jgi:glycerol-3-phosphate acyltransferase PlsX
MIAVDAMGGDQAPHAIVQGAIAAARHGIPILLIGQQEAITPHLPSDWHTLPIKLEFCTDAILMEEDPSRAIRTKPNSSIVKGMRAVAQGTATAFFSAGNSGAVLVASIFIIGRLPGVFRPAIGTFLPSRTSSFFCLDIGANVDCKAQYLYQFAIMGHAYLQIAKGIVHPRIGLLSNGHEPYKGSIEVKKAYDYLKQSDLNFIGNVESRELGEDIVDVVVCDGFVGNVMLKTMQGIARTMFHWMKDEAKSSWIQRCFLWLNQGLFKAIKHRMDYTAIGGALLLGVNHPVIVAHGSSDARAIENGIKFAYRIVQEEQVKKFNILLKSFLDDNHTLANVIKQKVRSLLHWRQR